MTEQRFCFRCKTFKSLHENFSPSYIKAGLQLCRSCKSEAREQYYERRRVQGKDTPFDTVRSLITTKKIRYDGTSIKVGITTDDLMAKLKRSNNRCELSGVDFHWTHKDKVKDGCAKWNSISIDRIKADGDYTPENTRLVLNCLNMLMMNRGLNHALFICNRLINKDLDESKVDLDLKSVKDSIYHSAYKIKLRRKNETEIVSKDDLLNKLILCGGKCTLTGIEMTWKGKDTTRNGKAKWNSMSVDKIDPDAGYTVKNTRFVLYCVNAFKGRTDDATLLKVASALISNAGGGATDREATT